MVWVIATAIVVAAAALEGVMSGPRPMAFLAELEKPGWSLPPAGWIVVGLVFYAIIGFALARTLAVEPPRAGPVGLLVGVLVANALWNGILFRIRRIDLARLALNPYAALVAVASFAVAGVDPYAGAAMVPYLAFLIYDFLWVRALELTNPRFAARPAA